MRIKGQKGAAVVEFAVIAPLLLVILFGIIEFGVLLYDKAMITNASREGARAGIVFANPPLTVPALTTKIQGVVNTYCATNLISFGGSSTLTTVVSRPTTTPGDPLTVTVRYPFRFLVFSNLLPLLGGNMANTLTLSAITVMRLE